MGITARWFIRRGQSCAFFFCGIGKRHSGSGQGERHRRTKDANGSGPEFTLLMGGVRRGLPGLGDAHHDHCTKDVRLGGLTSPRFDLPHSSAPPVKSTLPCPKQNPAVSAWTVVAAPA